MRPIALGDELEPTEIESGMASEEVVTECEVLQSIFGEDVSWEDVADGGRRVFVRARHRARTTVPR